MLAEINFNISLAVECKDHAIFTLDSQRNG